MYIAARTEDDEVVFWNGCDWTYDASDAEEYGTFRGAFEMGQLEAQYTEEPRKTWRGIRISWIYELS